MVRFSNPSIVTNSVQVPCTKIVVGKSFFSLESVPFNDWPWSQCTVIVGPVCVHADETENRTETTPPNLINAASTCELRAFIICLLYASEKTFYESPLANKTFQIGPQPKRIEWWPPCKSQSKRQKAATLRCRTLSCGLGKLCVAKTRKASW